MTDIGFTEFDRFIHDCEWEIEYMERVCRKNGNKLLAMVKDQVKTIDDLKAQLSGDKWICVEDRLPEKDGFYLGTAQNIINTWAEELKYYREEWRLPNGSSYKPTVIAWKPMPVPFLPTKDKVTL